MAIIYTYPQINSSSDLAASDLMIISDMSANGKPTKALKLSDLATFITNTGTGSGTTNKITKWTDGASGVLGDSSITDNGAVSMSVDFTVNSNSNNAKFTTDWGDHRVSILDAVGAYTFTAADLDGGGKIGVNKQIPSTTLHVGGTGTFDSSLSIPLIPTANAHATSKQYVDQQIASIPAGLVFQGNWNANTNTPALASGTGTVGNYYVVSVAGNTNLDGITDWEVGDWAVFVEVGGVDKWDKIDQTFVQGAGATGQVSFWNGINSVTGDNELYWNNANKRLGIGISSPQSILHITDANPVFIMEDTSNPNKNKIENVDGNMRYHADYNSDMGNSRHIFFIDNSEKVRFDSNGNVGIGTTSPSYKLDVNAGTDNQSALFESTDVTNTIGIKDSATTLSTSTGIGVVGDDLFLYAGGTAYNQRLRVQGSTGNVGVGTSNPYAKLHITGADSTASAIRQSRTGTVIWDQAIDSSGRLQWGTRSSEGGTRSVHFTLDDNGKVGIGTTSPSRLLQVKDTSGIASIAITSANTGTAQLELGGTSDNDIAGISYNSSTQKLFLKTNNTGQLYVDNSGNVGIGTSSPSTTLEIGTSGVIDTDFQMQSDQAGKYFKIVSAGNFTELKSVGDQNLFLNSSGSGGYVSFLAGNSERMRINYNGKVGIGTTSPDKKLDVTVDTSDDGVILQTVSGRKSLEMLVDNGTNGQGKIHFYTGANLLYGRIMADTNGLNITQLTADKDISFQADDGSGGITEYFRLDGSLTINRFYKNTRLDDSVQLQVGTSADLQILHNGTDSFIDNYTGNLTIRNRTDDGDIVFTCDDGSGGLAEYFRVDGGTERNIFSKDSEHGDNISAYFGSGNNMRILYNGSHGFISQNVGGDLRIVQNVDDGDIKFEADDGSGGVTTYFKLDGGNVNVSVAKDFLFQDNVKAKFGNSSDLQIYHDGTDSRIYNNAGDFVIRNQQDDGDIKFQSDDGSGGAATYFFLDGSNAFTQVLKDFYFLDNVKARFGDSGDFTIHHNTNTFLKNVTNNLIIENTVDDANIQFKCDDGSGGTTEYFRVDGSTTTVAFSQTITQIDNKYIGLGNSFDFHLQHNGTNSVITNSTGNLEIRQNANIADIIFYADGGSGSAVEYMRLDGSQVSIRMKRQVKWDDNIKATFGDSDDLEIYHDGTDSYVSDTGTGDLIIQGSNDIWIKEGTNNLARFNGQGLKFYYANVSKLETISSGAKLPGPGDGITLVSPDGNTTRKISIDNSGNLVVA